MNPDQVVDTRNQIRFHVITFGCRVNQADSQAIEDGLFRRGALTAPPDAADVVIVNTCSVTASADQGARQIVRRVARSNPDVKILVTGCYATRCANEVAELPNVIKVISNNRKDDVAALVEEMAFETTAERFVGGEGPCGAGLRPGMTGRTALTLRVQTGCDERCSYCVIPQTRGQSRSRPQQQVLAEVTRAVEAGYKEVAITGVHLGSYGRDLGDGTSLTGLVRALASWPDDVLFRISSLEPMDCSTEIVTLVARSPRLAPHFHLPLQHGSDDVLAMMQRPYSTDYYRRLVERIRSVAPDAAIGSDVIVGFPGESTRHFEESRELLERLPLTHLHVFPYSDRPGTIASKSPHKVDGSVVRERGRQVRAIGERMAAAFRHSQSGKLRRALTVDGGWAAVTDNYLKVRLAEPHPRNAWVQVTIDHPH